MLQERHGYSQRRACQIVGQHRSTQRHRPKVSDPDAELRARLRSFAKDHQRWGYRRAHAVLCREVVLPRSRGHDFLSDRAVLELCG